jgi:Aldehyde dehydrogenase family
MHHEERAKLMFRIADLLDARAEEFGMREAMDMGMPFHDFVTIIMPHCSGLFRFFAGLAMHMNGGYRQSYEADIKILTRREPLGVVAAITPFNFPQLRSRLGHPDRRHASRVAAGRRDESGHGMAQHVAQVSSERSIWRIQDERLRP